jgi:hypothetical protein
MDTPLGTPPQKLFFITIIAIILVLACTVAAVPSWAETKAEIRQEKSEIRKMAREKLSRLYKLQPSAKSAVSKSAGYAVFSNFGMKIFVAGGGSGKGIVIDSNTKKETFMKMGELQSGIGMGEK